MITALSWIILQYLKCNTTLIVFEKVYAYVEFASATT